MADVEALDDENIGCSRAMQQLIESSDVSIVDGGWMSG